MTPKRKQAGWFFVAAFVAGVIAFLALFVGDVDHFIAGGIALLGFVGFLFCFNKGYDLWVDQGAGAATQRQG